MEDENDLTLERGARRGQHVVHDLSCVDEDKWEPPRFEVDWKALVQQVSQELEYDDFKAMEELLYQLGKAQRSKHKEAGVRESASRALTLCKPHQLECFEDAGEVADLVGHRAGETSAYLCGQARCRT